MAIEVTQMPEPKPFVVEPRCAACGRPATHVELRPEGNEWRFIYEGIEAGNGSGDIVTEERARLLTAALAVPPNFELMREADLHYDNAGYSPECRVPYCSKHWHPSSTGYGRCPKGHGQSLDPHWSLDW